MEFFYNFPRSVIIPFLLIYLKHITSFHMMWEIRQAEKHKTTLWNQPLTRWPIQYQLSPPPCVDAAKGHPAIHHNTTNSSSPKTPRLQHKLLPAPYFFRPERGGVFSLLFFCSDKWQNCCTAGNRLINRLKLSSSCLYCVEYLEVPFKFTGRCSYASSLYFLFFNLKKQSPSEPPRFPLLMAHSIFLSNGNGEAVLDKAVCRFSAQLLQMHCDHKYPAFSVGLRRMNARIIQNSAIPNMYGKFGRYQDMLKFKKERRQFSG